MKSYLAVTLTLFVLITLAHGARAYMEPGIARDPWFLLTTALSAGMAVWAVTLLRKAGSPPS